MKHLDFSSQKTCTKLSLFCKAFSNSLRIQILCLLSDKGITVSEIVDSLDASKHNISQQLKHLRLLGLIEQKKEGRYVYCRVVDHPVVALLQELQVTLGRQEFDRFMKQLN